MLSRAVIAGALCFFLGWALVLISGHGGNSTGGSELVWEVGGILVYVSMAILPITALAALGFVVRSGVRRLRDPR
jgi:hypothetical protein